MPVFQITAPDGRKFRVTAPEGATSDEALARVQAQYSEPTESVKEEASPSFTDTAMGVVRGAMDANQRFNKNIGAGFLKGASDIGTTLMRPVDAALNATGITTTTNEDRKASLKGFFDQNADPGSVAFKGGELGADIAGTAGVGGLLAKGARSIPLVAQYAPRLAAALESGGFSLGGTPATTIAGKVGEAVTRAVGGAAVGGASAGLVNSGDAGAGAALGGALPGAVKVAGTAGAAMAPKIATEVADLYKKAKALGIDIPADRLTDSKPMNAAAASLNYVPFSGRAATEDRMASQFNRALSRTFGQDSDNITGALRKASTALGDKFEVTLKSHLVRADNVLLDDLVSHLETADKELGSEGAKIIGNQVESIMSKVKPDGTIDGQAAYNIKKRLDVIGSRNSSEAFYARELKKSLMGALNRSLGPDEAAKFAKVRQQYGNMLDLEGLAQNGAEGGISIARVANMKNINNQPLQDLADIAAQFLKTRESPHGAAQRVVLGTLGLGAAGATGTLPVLGAGVVAGRATNTALNSNTLKSLLIDQKKAAEQVNRLAGNKTIRSLIYNEAN